MTVDHQELTQKLMDTFFQFRRSHRIHKPILGLKYSEIIVLFRIKELSELNQRGASVSELSKELKVTSPSVTQIINHLEERHGLVHRAMDPEDRRSVRVTLTPEGKEFIDKASAFFYSIYSGLVEHLGAEKSLLLADLLTETIGYFEEALEKHTSSDRRDAGC